jgi:hypothetical protein
MPSAGRGSSSAVARELGRELLALRAPSARGPALLLASAVMRRAGGRVVPVGRPGAPEDELDALALALARAASCVTVTTGRNLRAEAAQLSMALPHQAVAGGGGGALSALEQAVRSERAGAAREVAVLTAGLEPLGQPDTPLFRELRSSARACTVLAPRSRCAAVAASLAPLAPHGLVAALPESPGGLAGALAALLRLRGDLRLVGLEAGPSSIAHHDHGLFSAEADALPARRAVLLTTFDGTPAAGLPAIDPPLRLPARLRPRFRHDWRSPLGAWSLELLVDLES